MNIKGDHVRPEVGEKHDEYQKNADKESNYSSCHEVSDVRQNSVLFFFETNKKHDNSSSDDYEDNLIQQPPQKIIWFPL